MELSGLYRWEARAGGIVVAAQYDAAGRAQGFGDLAKLERPFELHAKPSRTGMPSFSCTVPPGGDPIFENVAYRRIGHPERLGAIVGRRFPDGREEVLLVLWTGESAPFDSVEVARSLFLGKSTGRNTAPRE